MQMLSTVESLIFVIVFSVNCIPNCFKDKQYWSCSILSIANNVIHYFRWYFCLGGGGSVYEVLKN